METNEQPVSAPPERAARSAHFYSSVHRWQTLMRRHWWIPALTVALAILLQGYLIWNAPPLFLSFGQMIVAPQLKMADTQLYMEDLSQFLGTQVALMQSGTVQQRAQERLQKLQPELPRVPVKVQVVVTPKTTIFVFKATGLEPNYTQKFLQACMEEYKLLKQEMRAATSDTTLAGITARLTELDKDLRKGEDELLGFQRTNNFNLGSAEQVGNSAGNALAEKSRQLDDRRAEYQLLSMLTLEQTLDRGQRNIGSGNQDSVGTADPLPAGPEYAKAKQQIQQLKLDMQELSEFLRPKHPKMKKLSEEIDSREKMLGFYQKQTQEQLASRLSSLSLEITNLEQQVELWTARSQEANTKIAEYQRLKSRNQRDQANYDHLLSMSNTLGVNKDVSSESVTIMEPASPPEAYRGTLAKDILLAACAGLAVGIGILFLLNRLDDRLNSYTELKSEFDEEVLGQIPRDREARRGGASQLIRRDDDRHAFIEAYRNLRSSLHYLSHGGTPRKTLLVTSSIPNDGKSMTTANLAITTALAGTRVLLVDADLRKGVLHQRFEVESGPGLSEALTDGRPWAPSVKATNIPNLFLLPRGATTQRSSEMFLSAAAPAFLREAAAQYDVVIIDSAPVMAADDVTSLAPHVDGVIFVIRAQQTSARVAHAALELLYQRHVNVLGLVFNAVEANVSEYYYYKYRDYYASYPAK